MITMKKAIIYLTGAAMLLLAGCASAPAGTDYTKSTKPVNPQVPADVPDWYMETPSDGEYVYVTGMGNGSNINIALGKAKAFAQQEMSEQISADGYRVAFSGTAADELYTGYFDHYLFLY